MVSSELEKGTKFKFTIPIDEINSTVPSLLLQEEDFDEELSQATNNLNETLS